MENSSEQTAKKPYVWLNRDKQERKTAYPYFVAAVVLLCGLYLSELLHLLEQPLFSLVYYGNLRTIFFALFSTVYLLLFLPGFHIICRNTLKTTPFKVKREPLSVWRKLTLYLMAVVPVFLVAAFRGFEFNIVYEMGLKVTGMALYSNLAMYGNVLMKLIYAVYFIYLVEEGARRIFKGGELIPFGSIALFFTFGLIELLISIPKFNALDIVYLLLSLYYGVVYVVSKKRYLVTFFIAFIVYVL